jgi:parallel beta helix pectate lyase-like protein
VTPAARRGHLRRTFRHRRPWFRRADVLVPLIVLALAVTATGVWFSRAYEPPPDTAAAGPGYWVSTHGDDDEDGSAGRPWRTVGHAVRAARAGSTIFLRNGTYRPFAVDRPNLTVTSAPGERATIAGRAGTRDVLLITAAGVTVSGLTVQGCVPKPNADVDITGDHGSGIRIDRTTRVTVRGVVVRDSHGRNAAGLPAGCYGILVSSSRDVTVTGSELYHNGAGIVVSRGGRGVLVRGNNVHDQDVIVQNTAAAQDDFGGYGLAATFITDKPGPVFKGNTVEGNAGPSTDYGVDGGGMELYDAANTTITGNTFAGNDGVMETGSGSKGRCADDVFTGNAAAGLTSARDQGSNTGLVLRCAANLVVRDNTFTGLDKFTFLLATGGDFAGSIDGLQVQDNTVTRAPGAVVFRLQFDSGTSPAVSIDRNRYGGARDSFAIMDTRTGPETPMSFARWRSATAYDAASTLF